jgi:hypothetical protein
MLPTRYQARWISKEHAGTLRKAGQLKKGVLVDSLKGLVIVEPVGSKMGDGDQLRPEDADYELRPAWCLTPTSTLCRARQMLGLKSFEPEKSTTWEV